MPIAYRFAWRGVTESVELGYARGVPAWGSVGTGTPLPVRSAVIDTSTVAAEIAARRRQARYQLAGNHVYLWLDEEQYDFVLDDPRTHEFSASAATGGLTTPLPGVVVAVPVAVGENVAAGDVLMVIEAMKMEHSITAPYAGAVQAIHFARGDRVPQGAQLLELRRTAET